MPRRASRPSRYDSTTSRLSLYDILVPARRPYKPSFPWYSCPSALCIQCFINVVCNLAYAHQSMTAQQVLPLYNFLSYTYSQKLAPCVRTVKLVMLHCMQSPRMHAACTSELERTHKSDECNVAILHHKMLSQRFTFMLTCFIGVCAALPSSTHNIHCQDHTVPSLVFPASHNSMQFCSVT